MHKQSRPFGRLCYVWCAEGWAVAPYQMPLSSRKLMDPAKRYSRHASGNVRGQMLEVDDRGQMSEDRIQNSEVGRQEPQNGLFSSLLVRRVSR